MAADITTMLVEKCMDVIPIHRLSPIYPPQGTDRGRSREIAKVDGREAGVIEFFEGTAELFAQLLESLSCEAAPFSRAVILERIPRDRAIRFSNQLESKSFNR
jgi:hypothetical protein